MSDRSYYADCIERMLGAIEEIFQHRAAASSKIAYKAILFELIVVGETASKISSEIRGIAPEIPWYRIISLRHRLVHAPDTVDPQAIEEIEEVHLPILKENLMQLLSELKG